MQRLIEIYDIVIDPILDISILILLALLITGCATSTPPSIIQEKPIYHPEWPMPYQVCQVDWEVVIINQEPLVALSYDDSLTLASCTQDMLRYVRDMKNKFCYYRPEQDLKCVKDKKEK